MQRRMAKFRHSDSSNINGNGNGKLLPRERSVSGLVRVRSQPSRIGVEDGAWLGTVSPSVRSPVKLPSRFSTESQPYALGVQINGHETVGKGINAHTMYKITLTRYDRSVLKVKRRYNDFVLLRDMLFTRYREFRKRILPLPEKRVIGKRGISHSNVMCMCELARMYE
ncbi:hypothetical protein EV182_004267 [Spiromyces aspiralis]|uniref:Uncharacterized protein n=1 Tax=Spiromyces aspiralis TaxID=68401 RepID=A0ACC1HQ40_9FUNG|nr:hypothetical protein EV182_004267 [Spiromyces aspiralis]